MGDMIKIEWEIHSETEGDLAVDLDDFAGMTDESAVRDHIQWLVDEHVRINVCGSATGGFTEVVMAALAKGEG